MSKLLSREDLLLRAARDKLKEARQWRKHAKTLPPKSMAYAKARLKVAALMKESREFSDRYIKAIAP